MTKKIRGTLFFLSILGDLANSMILITAIFYGEEELQLDPFWIGVIGAAYGITYLITPAILGRIGDKIPRKTSLLIASIGHLFTALFFLLFARTPALLITGQILLGIFYGFYWPSIEAYTSESASDTSERSHKRAILSFCIAWSIGYMLGPLIAGLLGDFFLYAFITIVLLYAIEVILVIVNLPSENPQTMQKPVIDEIHKNERKKNTISVFIQLVLTVFLYATTSKTLYIYFVDYAVQVEGLAWSEPTTGLVLFFFGLGRTIYFIVNYFWLSIRSSMKLNIFTFLAMAICIVCIPFFSSIAIISIIMFLGGICVAIIYSSTLDLMLHEEQKGKGAKAGIFESMVGLGSILTPIVAGALATGISFTIPFYVMAGVIFVVFVVFLVFELGTSKRKID